MLSSEQLFCISWRDSHKQDLPHVFQGLLQSKHINFITGRNKPEINAYIHIGVEADLPSKSPDHRVAWGREYLRSLGMKVEQWYPFGSPCLSNGACWITSLKCWSNGVGPNSTCKRHNFILVTCNFFHVLWFLETASVITWNTIFLCFM